MKNLVSLLFLFSLVACGQPNESRKAEVVEFNPEQHVLGKESDWLEFKRDLLFTDSESNYETDKLPQDRKANLQPKEALAILHSWFVEGAGYATVINGDYEYVVLSPIPEPVTRSILTRMDVIETGFGFLDSKFWNQIIKNQKKGFKFAFITRSGTRLAGFYQHDQKLIALDIFANSGTIAHEMQHYLDFQKIDLAPSLFNKIEKECKAQMSSYFGEVSATLVQIPVWEKVFEDADFLPDSIQDYEFEGGAWVAQNLFMVFSSNLNYPDLKFEEFKASGVCPQSIQDIIKKVAEASDLHRRIISGEEEAMLDTLYRDIYAGLLIENQDKCLLDVEIPLEPRCDEIAEETQDVVDKVDATQKEVVKRIKAAYEDRKKNVNQILQQMPADYFAESCRAILGFASLTNCEEKK